MLLLMDQNSEGLKFGFGISWLIILTRPFFLSWLFFPRFWTHFILFLSFGSCMIDSLTPGKVALVLHAFMKLSFLMCLTFWLMAMSLITSFSVENLTVLISSRSTFLSWTLKNLWISFRAQNKTFVFASFATALTVYCLLAVRGTTSCSPMRLKGWTTSILNRILFLVVDSSH